MAGGGGGGGAVRLPCVKCNVRRACFNRAVRSSARRRAPLSRESRRLGTADDRRAVNSGLAAVFGAAGPRAAVETLARFLIATAASLRIFP